MRSANRLCVSCFYRSHCEEHAVCSIHTPCVLSRRAFLGMFQPTVPCTFPTWPPARNPALRGVFCCSRAGFTTYRRTIFDKFYKLGTKLVRNLQRSVWGGIKLDGRYALPHIKLTVLSHTPGAWILAMKKVSFFAVLFSCHFLSNRGPDEFALIKAPRLSHARFEGVNLLAGQSHLDRGGAAFGA